MARARRMRPRRAAAVPARSNAYCRRYQRVGFTLYPLFRIAKSCAHGPPDNRRGNSAMNQKIAFLLPVIISLAMPSSASHPLCARIRNVKAEFDAATAVFQGRVVGEEERDLPHPKGPVKKSQVFRFIVEQWWKGENKKEAEVHVLKIEISKGKYTFGSESFIFKKEKRYLVYAFGDKAMLTTNGCTRTKSIKRAQEDLNLLGKGQKPEP